MDLMNVIGYLFLTVFVKYATTLKHFGNFEEDLTYGRVHHLFPMSRWRRGTNRSPPRPSLFVEVEGRPLRLSLTLNPRLSGGVMVYPQRGNICNKGKKVDLYQDSLHGASIEIQTSAAGLYILSGTFSFGHHHYFIKTVTSFKSFHQVSRVPLLISKITTSSDLRYDYIISNTKTLNYKPLRRDLPVRHKRSGTVYTVELFLTIDYSIYKFWYEQNSNITENGERRNAAINDIKQYYAFLVNGVDVRYKNLPGSTDTINVIFAGIYIAETAASWSGSLDSLNRLDVMSAGDAFEKWRTSQLNSNSIPDHDHAMLFTRYNLALHNQTAATGFAYVSSVCSDGSISIVEEKFDLISYTIAAHELGHSLGATHEGVGTNTCPDEGYVMSAVSRPHVKSTNPWRFSSCSVSQISNYISSLSPNCLLQETSSVDRNSLQAFESSPLGQTYQADQQCELSFGPGALVCRELHNSTNYQEICTTLQCKEQGSTSCKVILPADGTTCGNQKWCQNGVCMYNSSSPAADETCLFGDEPGTVCTQIKTNSWDCYGNNYRKCCRSCESIRSSDANCPFGDRAPGCSFLTTDNRINCYDLDTYSQCCGSCKKLSTNNSGCEYGDRVENCDAQNSCSSQQTSTNCCATCSKVTSTTSSTGTSSSTITSTTSSTTSTSQSTTKAIFITTSTSTSRPVTTTQSPTSTTISTTPTSTHVPTTETAPTITTSSTTKHTTTTPNPTTKLTTTTQNPTTTSTTTAKPTTTAQSPKTSTITITLSTHIITTTPAVTTSPTTKHPSTTTTAQIPTTTRITTTTFPSPTTSTFTSATYTTAQTTRQVQTTSTKATPPSSTITKENVTTTVVMPTTEITTAAKPTIKSTTTAAKTTSRILISTTDVPKSGTPLVFTPSESDSTTTDLIKLATPRNLAPGEETPIMEESWFLALIAVLGVIFSFVLVAFLYALRKKHYLRSNSLKLHKKHVILGYENPRYSSTNLFEIPPEIDNDVADEYNEIPLKYDAISETQQENSGNQSHTNKSLSKTNATLVTNPHKPSLSPTSEDQRLSKTSNGQTFDKDLLVKEVHSQDEFSTKTYGDIRHSTPCLKSKLY